MVKSKIEEWDEFSDRVRIHIREYVFVQYGDFPDDFLERMTIDDMIHDVERYLRRAKTAVRGEEDSKRDLLKVAHYMSLIMMKKEGRFMGDRQCQTN